MRSWRITGAPGTSSATSSTASSARLLVDGVDLRDRDDAGLDSEQAHDREVLERLRSRALGRVDDEQEQVDPRRPGDHVADEALVTGNVHDRQPAPVGSSSGA